MKRLFKNLLIGFASPLVILPIVGCTQTKQQEKKETKTIEIVSDLEDITVPKEDSHVSKPIEAKCYGPDKKERQLDIKFSLKAQEDSSLPNWICINDKNEIQLTGGKEIGSYTFSVVAYNDKEKLYSESKSFNVNVIEERHIVPTEIEINIQQKKYCMYGKNHEFPLTITPKKEEIEERYLLKDCDISLKVITGKETDIMGKDLFSILTTQEGQFLTISQYTDVDYQMKYTVRLTAQLKADPTITTSYDVSFQIINTTYYYDELDGLTYTRPTEDDDWELSLVDSSNIGISNVAYLIQDAPVTKVADYLCKKSGNTKLYSVILPTSITTIGEHAFDGITSLKNIQMPGVKKIGSYAFYNDNLLEYDSRRGYPSLTSVGEYAFYGCKMFDLQGEHNITEIGDYAFTNAGLAQFKIGKNCTYIGKGCFKGCASLSYLRIKAIEPPILGGETFSECDKLKIIYVPSESVHDYEASQHWSGVTQIIEGI